VIVTLLRLVLLFPDERLNFTLVLKNVELLLECWFFQLLSENRGLSHPGCQRGGPRSKARSAS
jgi:hypothetical protein